MKQRPNVLFLMSDQHRADVAGFGGNRVVRTPVLDKLAEKGTVFSNAYTPSPICVPGRQAMMAGQLPRTCNCVSYGEDLTPGFMTFARLFSQYAYHTVCCGKLHHMGADQMQGWNLRVGHDNEISPAHIDGRVKEEFEKREGSSQWWPWDKEVRRAAIGRSRYVVRDEYAVEGALNVIREHFLSSDYDKQRTDQPILLKVSLNSPHYPYLTDQSRFEYYLNRVTPFLDQEQFDHPVVTRDWDIVRVGETVTERDVRRATAAYYGMIDYMDSLYGRVLDALWHAGQDLDNWLVIYTSDHGDMIGEHGIWMKYKYFEGSARAPLIIRWPERFGGGQTVHENVNLCDLFATLCDCAGIPVPDGLDSRSLVPLLDGETAEWDNETVSQLDGTVMIKRDHLKYQYFGPDEDEVLFDLDRDPGETTNFMDDPACAAQVAAFRSRCAELGYASNAQGDGCE